MTQEDKQLIISTFESNRKGFYTWLFCNKKRFYLVEQLRLMYPNAESDLERAYWLVFDMNEPPTCPVCGKKIKFSGGGSRGQNGYNTHCCHKCGTTDPHHQQAIKATKLDRYGDPNWSNAQKATATCIERYGGNGIRGNRDKAKQTMMQRYGVEYYTSSQQLSEMRNNKEIQSKIQESKRRNNTFNSSKSEDECYNYLCNKYGIDQVVRQYKDEMRYPFNCDFYIKSHDLFIELNLFPTHYSEPFDECNDEHVKYLEHCKSSPTNWVEEQTPLIWAGTDVLKYQIAQKNNLNYIRIYDLGEFYEEENKCC